MLTKIKSTLITLLIACFMVSCTTSGNKEPEVIVLGEMTSNPNGTGSDNNAKIDNRKLTDVATATVVDSMFDKINEESCNRATFALNAQIDIEEQIAGMNTKLQMVVNGGVLYQNTEEGPQLLINGEGMWDDDNVSSPLVIECYYGKLDDNNSFYFNDFAYDADWYYLESDMLVNLVKNEDLLESQIKDYLYASNVYDSRYKGKDCYQIVLNTEDYRYVDYIVMLFKHGEVENYWDAWQSCYYNLGHVTIEDVLKTFDLEISVYVAKEDYSFEAMTVCSEGIEIGLDMKDGEHELFTAPDNISSEPYNFANENDRAGFVKYISNRLFIYSDTPNYYYDEENSEVRLIDTDYNEIARFVVPDGYKAYGDWGNVNYFWYFVKDSEMTNYEFNSLSKADIDTPHIVISLSYEDEDYMGSYPNRKNYKYEWVNYIYGNKEIYILKRTSHSDGTITYIAYVPYHSAKKRGEKVYVGCSFIDYEDYPIGSDELKELVFSILK